MAKIVYLDTGPLVAFFSKRDKYHHWAQDQIRDLDSKLVTCEAVITETLFITNNSPKVIAAIQGMMNDGLLTVEPVLQKSFDEIFRIMTKYEDLPASFADVSLIHLYDQQKESKIFTIDSDFLIYRDTKGKPLNLISPYKS